MYTIRKFSKSAGELSEPFLWTIIALQYTMTGPFCSVAFVDASLHHVIEMLTSTKILSFGSSFLTKWPSWIICQNIRLSCLYRNAHHMVIVIATKINVSDANFVALRTVNTYQQHVIWQAKRESKKKWWRNEISFLCFVRIDEIIPHLWNIHVILVFYALMLWPVCCHHSGSCKVHSSVSPAVGERLYSYFVVSFGCMLRDVQLSWYLTYVTCSTPVTHTVGTCDKKHE